MDSSNTLDIILKWFGIIGLCAIAGFLCYGWLKGLYWEKQLHSRRRHR